MSGPELRMTHMTHMTHCPYKCPTCLRACRRIITHRPAPRKAGASQCVMRHCSTARNPRTADACALAAHPAQPLKGGADPTLLGGSQPWCVDPECVLRHLGDRRLALSFQGLGN